MSLNVQFVLTDWTCEGVDIRHAPKGLQGLCPLYAAAQKPVVAITE